jgi:phosphatidylglycerophosphatase C
MGTRLPARQGQRGVQPIVAFDFDGTLTVRDSFAAFIAWRTGWPRLMLGLVRLAPAACRWLADRDRGRLKAAATRIFLGGLDVRRARDEAEAFAAAKTHSLLRPDAVARWNAWRDQGARLVVVTASPEIIVAPFARRLGADKLIGTRLKTDGHGAITGAFVGENCRGPEKVSRLRKAFGAGVSLAAAYGDSAGDREMLQLAKEAGMKVFHARP